MGRMRGALLKRCRALGISPQVMGYDKALKAAPREVRRKKSEYGLQLTEKQKVKFVYGILERQFRLYYVMATKRTGVTGEVLLQLLESRLDNVVYRLGFAKTRNEARQMVGHAHVLVNGKKVKIPSYLVVPGDVVSLKPHSFKEEAIKAISRKVPSWLELNKDAYSGKVVALSMRSDIDFPVKEQLIVEYYSK